MSIELWIAFVATSAVLLAMPGPTVLTIVNYSISHGRRVNAPLVTAVALGDSTCLAMSLLGLGALLAASPFWFAAVKYAGGLYLLGLGYRLLRARAAAVGPDDAGAAQPYWKLSLNAYLVTALNPQAITFFVAFLPQFVDPQGDVTRQSWMLALTFVALGMVNSAVYAGFASSARRLLATPRAHRLIQVMGGVLLSAFGVGALLAQRA
ncbi:LysE family translocator [Achromobacter aloeverae]|uniref:Lysine transporter LysE n=1 Tax=Achromobacter aloeverae TaxID=1750518 RepID=A0A4Q1HPF0_9BURK|nr:LysE family translocator [Achromobacter aloeverae]RXN91414.1 lysine transporter LysE [Achromobacter aloeverae]